MVRHTAHRGALVKSAVTCRQCELKLARRSNRVIEEQLVKVAEAKEDEAVGVLLLLLNQLHHHRREPRSIYIVKGKRHDFPPRANYPVLVSRPMNICRHSQSRLGQRRRGSLHTGRQLHWANTLDK
jgi:hypothetical protein